MNQKLISVIIPVKNESGNIIPIIEGFKNFKYPTELIFVIGKSTDGTENVINNASLKDYDFHIRVVFPNNEGKGNAVWTGFSVATGSVLAIFDGDLTIPHHSLEKMINKCLQTEQVICGNRLVRSNFKSFPRPNIFYNKIISFIFNRRFGTHLNDILCGAKILPFDCYKKILPYRNFFSKKDKWGDLEILSASSICRFSILNVDVEYLPRTYGESKISILRDGTNFLQFLTSTLFKCSPKFPNIAD